MFSHRLIRSLVAAACLVLVALAAPAARASERSADRGEPRLVIPGPGVLRAGQEVELRWTGGEGEGDELEIMLTIEGPRRRTVQISPHLDPERGVFVWRVPELGHVSGRFRVRYERDHHEVEGTPSARWEILSGIAPPIAPALLPDATLPGAPASGPVREARAPDAERETSQLARDVRETRSAVSDANATASWRVGVPSSRDCRTPAFVPARN